MWEWEKKSQKLYVLMVKARGGVKSAPAITLDFWLGLKKNTRWSSPVSKGGGSGIDFFLSVGLFCFWWIQCYLFQLFYSLIVCYFSLPLSLSLSLSVTRVFELMLLPLLTIFWNAFIFGHLGTIFCLLLWLVVSVEYLLKARTRACISMTR